MKISLPPPSIPPPLGTPVDPHPRRSLPPLRTPALPAAAPTPGDPCRCSGPRAHCCRPRPYGSRSKGVLSEFDEIVKMKKSAVKSYIVYLGGHAHDIEGGVLADDKHIEESHYKFLGTFLGDEGKARDAIFYSYTKHVNGFSANLEEKDALEISKHPSVVSIFPSRKYQLQTTRSWSFLGLDRDGRVPIESIWNKARFGEDSIIVNLDSGFFVDINLFQVSKDKAAELAKQSNFLLRNINDTLIRPMVLLMKMKI